MFDCVRCTSHHVELWLKFAEYKLSIEQTPLPAHINRLVDILISEEVEQDGREGAIGSCMEYLLQHRILETLYSLAGTDVSISYSFSESIWI